ncbi:MAG: ferredoxin [Acutalibacteraceae bacterium]
MTVYVNENGIEYGLCNSICLEVFTMTDEGVATASYDISESQKESVQEAADSCPIDTINSTSKTQTSDNQCAVCIPPLPHPL